MILGFVLYDEKYEFIASIIGVNLKCIAPHCHVIFY